MDRGEADTRIEPPRLVAASPPPPHASNEMTFRPAMRASRAQQLEAENIRLRQMVSDLMLETEILRSAMRRNLSDVNSAAAR
ncbi:hypothetical protein [Phenylobacterium sp. J367]|uniref:hypothetical protein n=1 Tax=Phenylobacterium sp. J367 TaxID=2898435 RepID=UPI002151CCBF|nr:hypothetical protein [Phenylobacterium sp. J367]MCR5877495.1 hypothetical protein [Phenylobacterium sp. J367]